MIKIHKQENRLLLRYEADRFNDARWIDERMQQDGSVTLRRTFTFTPGMLVAEADPDDAHDDVRVFVLGVDAGDYFRIDNTILDLKHDLLLSKQMRFGPKIFIANREISVFHKIDDLIDEPIVVGGDVVGAIPLADFEDLLRNFPTTTELNHYARARITRVLKDYLGTMSDAQQRLDDYLAKRKMIRPTSRVQSLENYELEKFEYVRDELRLMLNEAETYDEKDWQKLIIGFLLLIFPKYIAVLENLQIKDFYSDPAKAKNRFIDLTLVDANGAIDIIEIKKPFSNCLLSRSKYRDNYTPRAELSGSVMQVEKYLFHLSKWGREGENQIQGKRKSELPAGFDIKITNPKGMIILGRDIDFDDDQLFDFEIIRRKYANVIDIMTYDDLLRRLDNIIIMIQHNLSAFKTNGGLA